MPPIKHRKTKKLTLDDILKGPDEFGLLNVKSKISRSEGLSAEIASFEELNAFIDSNKRCPKSSGGLEEARF